MTQGHHPDYDTLLHGAPLAHLPHQAHPQLGGHAPPPSHAMVPAHEMHSLVHGLRSEIAQLRDQQRPPPPPAHHEGRYADHDERERSDRRERRDHRQRHDEPDYGRSRPRARNRMPVGPLKIREFPVGFVQAAVAAGGIAEIEVKPQVRFQGHRLAVAASQSRYFNIVDIKVGKDSQLAATGEMPAEAFSSLAVGTQMELDCAPPGIVITLIVRNTDVGPQDFGAVLYGEVEEGGED